ncbi:hypothetical protein BWI96_20850 [Siphonobacter sp. SORGH_AS_0500]|uniref:hypothetical protein n=1 Tax=Siphonobacter sp. SORGH_AS_0500 TaxID=1864824 RepID=UPI000CB1A49A|nr:hypothetical protein [Siphonobacter sp. SORGH_AS_0500]PKK34678.1 hypothetical protein BWI96_20850 [Siphonobacter sp. SORGH_AS_0500]
MNFVRADGIYANNIDVHSLKLINSCHFDATSKGYVSFEYCDFNDIFTLNGKAAHIILKKNLIKKAVLVRLLDSDYFTLKDNTINEKLDIYSYNSEYRWDWSNNLFNSDIDLSDTQLPVYFKLKNNKFKTADYKLNFTYCKMDSAQFKYFNKNPLGKCLITLSPDNASNVIIDSKLFWIEYDSLFRYDEMLTVYEKVINTCRELNMEESIEGFDIQYQIFKIRHKYGIFGESIVQFQDYWWGFGYKRSNILLNIVWAFLASLLIVFIGYKKVFRAYSPNSDHDTELVIKECTESFLERFKVVFFYTALVFFSWRVDHARVDYRRYPWIALLIYTIYVIGLIHLAYLAAFVLAK